MNNPTSVSQFDEHFAYYLEHAKLSPRQGSMAARRADERFMRAIESHPNWGAMPKEAPIFRATALAACEEHNRVNGINADFADAFIPLTHCINYNIWRLNQR